MKKILNTEERFDIPYNIFGAAYAFHIEPSIYTTARDLSPTYEGGFWEFYIINNECFFQCPVDDYFKIYSHNGFECELSADAFGIAVCLFTYSQLAFQFHEKKGREKLTEALSNQYHMLRDYALDYHDEASKILRLID